MTEEEAKSVKNQETANPEANSESPTQKQDESSKELNFAKLREKAEKAERQNQELERQVRELKEAFERKNAPTETVEVDELDSLSPEDIVTVKQAMKLSEKQAKKIVQEMIEQKERASLPEKAKAMYSDFENVMTKENIQKFEQLEPGLAEACAKAKNPWDATYKMLKKFVLPQDEVKANKAEKKLEETLARPASSNSVGRAGPLSDANQWSEASRDELYKEMMNSAGQAY